VYVVIAASVITGVVFGLRGPQGITTLYEKRREIQQLQEQNATLQKEIQERKERIRQLQSDPAAQEEEIRRRYKLQRRGDTTFILPQ
jgi:cell division protein FtsB